jgi:hypothetical protein
VSATKLAVEPGRPVLISQPAGGQHVAPVAHREIERLAQTDDVTTRKQHDSCPDPFASEHVGVVTGPTRQLGQLPQYGVGGPWVRKVASDPSFKPQLGIGHVSILLVNGSSSNRSSATGDVGLALVLAGTCGGGCGQLSDGRSRVEFGSPAGLDGG